ncbi:MAG: hypothetical protein QOK23_197 [Gammaproteobacteria bacterium]|jgi:hypothetical protein|nr:hypothetical protein [Gammaproteobacteria bacterium]
MERVQVSAHRHQPLLTGGQQDLKAGLREVSISRQCPGKEIRLAGGEARQKPEMSGFDLFRAVQADT